MAGHITINLNGTEYPLLIDPNSYTEVDVTDFAPRAIAGNPTWSQLGLYLEVGQDNFAHGFGQWTFGEPQSYAYTGHQVDTRHGYITLYTNLQDNVSFNGQVNRMILHRDKHLFATSAGLYARNSSTGAMVFIHSDARDVLSNGKYFFVTRSVRMEIGDAGNVASATSNTLTASGSPNWDTNIFVGGTVYIYEGTGAGQQRTVSSHTGNQLTVSVDWTTTPDATSKFVVLDVAGNDSNPPNNFDKMAVFGGFFWAIEYATNVLHFWAETTGSDAEGGGTADAGAVKVGPPGISLVNLYPFNNQLWVFRPDGAWTVGEDNLAYHQLDFSTEISARNFLSVTTWNGFLVFPVTNTLYKYRSGLQEITPPRWDELPPFKQFGAWRGLVTRGRWLYVIGQSNTPNGAEEPDTETFAGFASIFATDGVGWHKLMDLPDNTSVVHYNMFLDSLNDYLYVSYVRTDASGFVFRIRLQDLNDLPYPNYPTSGQHAWYSSYYDLGMKRVPKSWQSLTLSGEFPSGTSVVAEFRKDDTTTWTTIGTFTQDLQEIALPDNTEGKKLQLRLKLSTSNAANTPVIRAVILKVMMRPDVKYGVNCIVTVSDNLSDQDRIMLGLTAKEIRQALKDARNSVSPFDFTDLFGVTQPAYLSSLRFEVIQYENEDSIQAVARCVFLFV